MSSEEIIEQYQLQKCDICNRSFQTNSLEKHQNICRKVNSKKRPAFDSKKQRTVPLPEDYRGPIKPVPPSNKGNIHTLNGTQFQRWSKPSEKQKRIPSKTRSLDDSIFRNHAKPRSLYNSKKAMIECPHCLRLFQEGSAERHIKFCEEIHSRIPAFNENWEAKSKLAIRTQYQPPPPRQGRVSNGSQVTPTTSRRMRRVAPVIEEGLTSNLPESFYHHRQHYTPIYNTKIELSQFPMQSPRKNRSKMVTYGAMQPFSGPVISKERLDKPKTRFTGKGESLWPQRIYIADQCGYQDENRDNNQIIMYPDTVSAQIQTDRLDAPESPKVAVVTPSRQVQPIYINPYQRNVYSTPYWHNNWQNVNPWCNEDTYLQMAPKFAAPMLYNPQWSPYPVLPDLSPRNYVPDPQTRHPRPMDYYQNESQRYHYQPPPPDRCLLARDDTILDDEYLAKMNSHSKHNYRYCGKCGSKFNAYGAHYCSDCGAFNK